MNSQAQTVLRLAAALIACTLASCSAQQTYAVGQGWQRTECNRIVDPQERQRCMSQANTSFESHQRQVEEAKASK